MKQQEYQGALSVKAGKSLRHGAAGKDAKVGIGLIGCGGIGRYLAEKVLKQSPRLEIRALCDPDQRSIDACRLQLCPSARLYHSYQDLCTARDIDWVMIASWNCFHKEQTVAAFEAGKHVFCQKPLAINAQDCLTMLNAWKKSGRLFNIGFTLRYSPLYRAVHDIVRKKTLGDIISMEFNEVLSFNHGGYIMGDWRRLKKYAGSHVLEKCCHDIDLANWIIGSRAHRVASFGGRDFYVPSNLKQMNRLGKGPTGRYAYRGWGGLVEANPFTSHKDIIDNQVVIIEYENGVRTTFHMNCNGGIPERRMYICGSEGALRADLCTGIIETARIGWNEKITRIDTGVESGHGGGDDVLAKELAGSMLKGEVPKVGIDEGLASAYTCFGIDEAMDKGRVLDMNAYWKKLK